MPSDDERPIEAGDSLWTEELTWMEVRDAVRAGKTTILIGTGGIEQNGPYLVGGKHNYVLATVLPEIARAIGNALIAPIVKFVPEGGLEPPDGHMVYPGTISLRDKTFEALLTDICISYKTHGFVDLILIGDSGGNQKGMDNVARTLNRKWIRQRANARVHYLPEYYEEDIWNYDFLKSQRIVQIDRSAPAGQQDQPSAERNGIHDDVSYEAMTAVQDPALIRVEQRLRAGLFSLHGVDLSPVAKTVELGRKLAAYRAGITAQAFQRSLRTLRG